MKQRSFDMVLGRFLATVAITEDPPNPRRYSCSARFNTRDPLDAGEPFHPQVFSADDVLDLLEVISASNEFIEALLPNAKHPGSLRLVKPSRRPGGGEP